MEEVCLSAKGLKQAALLDDHSKFTFVVGRGREEFLCARFQACFVSKKVCGILALDPTLEKLSVLPDRDCSCFHLIASLWNGDSICVDSGNCAELSMLSKELENDELSRLLGNCRFSNESISCENCVSRLRAKSFMALNDVAEIEFIASRFFELDASVVESLSVSELERVLQHESLKLENENALLDLMLKLAGNDDEYYSLFRYIRFEFMDAEHVSSFMDAIYPHRIDVRVWDSITRVIVSNLKNSVHDSRYVEKRELFEYDSSSPLKGIFSHLRSECDGNPHLKELIEVTASSSSMWGGCCYNVLDYGWGSHWHTWNKANSWIQFDFKDMRVSLASYTIRTIPYDPGSNHLRQWKVEVSNDGSKWTPVDARNTDALNGKSLVKNFECSQPTSDFSRYVRLTSTGKDWHNDDYLMLSEIEFFGRLTNQ